MWDAWVDADPPPPLHAPAAWIADAPAPSAIAALPAPPEVTALVVQEKNFISTGRTKIVSTIMVRPTSGVRGSLPSPTIVSAVA